MDLMFVSCLRAKLRDPQHRYRNRFAAYGRRQKSCATERFRLSGWSQAWSPSIRRSGDRGTPFGRCGETYPLRLTLCAKKKRKCVRVSVSFPRVVANLAAFCRC
jgi:hypothetical protein